MQVTTLDDLPQVSGFGSPDGLGLTIGDDDFAEEEVGFTSNPAFRALRIAYALASVAGTALGAYHGYKRNESVGWAIGWAALGGLFPIIVIPVAFAQGLGERK